MDLDELRCDCDWCSGCSQCSRLIERAANEIERLRAENAGLKLALQEVGCSANAVEQLCELAREHLHNPEDE